jgi:anti-sigma factor RsiW
MTSKHIIGSIDDYLLGGLDHSGRAEFEAHVDSCRRCREALASARQAGRVMQWLPNPKAAPQPGPDFFYRVQASIQKQQAQSWLGNLVAGMQPRLALPFVMMGMLLLAWIVSLPQHSIATPAPKTIAWEEVEYPAADFSLLTYFDDRDDTRYDRTMESIVEDPDAVPPGAVTF